MKKKKNIIPSDGIIDIFYNSNSKNSKGNLEKKVVAKFIPQ